MELTPELLIRAYASGIFPMSRSADGPIDWYSPDPRALLPLDAFHVRRSLRKRVRNGTFTVTMDRAFEQVIRGCAAPSDNSPGVWMSPAIIQAYTRLHRLGFAHSFEVWTASEDDPAGQPTHLAGGLYGVAIGGAFFGESMFSRMPYASQVCLVHLVDHLQKRHYALLDVQFCNPHLEQFGIQEINREDYLQRLSKAITMSVTWS